jgi:hypothetical protein
VGGSNAGKFKRWKSSRSKGNHPGGGRFKRWEVQTLEELEVHR